MHLILPKSNVEWRVGEDYMRNEHTLTATFTLPNGRQLSNCVRYCPVMLSYESRTDGYGQAVVESCLDELTHAVGRAMVRGA